MLHIAAISWRCERVPEKCDRAVVKRFDRALRIAQCAVLSFDQRTPLTTFPLAVALFRLETEALHICKTEEQRTDLQARRFTRHLATRQE